MTKTLDWLSVPIKTDWDRYKIIVSDGNPVGIRCKFEFSGGKRQMVEADSINFDVQLSVSPAAFLQEAAKVTFIYWVEVINNFYDLTNFLPAEVIEIKEELKKLINGLNIPDIFGVYVARQKVEPTEIMKTKYNFTKAIEIPSLPRTKEYDSYQKFITKLTNLKYI